MPHTTKHFLEVSSFPPGETFDNLQNYDIQEEIGQGRLSTVYIAICRRGRLRNRKIALKKIILSRANQSESSRRDNAESVALHQSLHHPSVVSLFSFFSTPSAIYHILELCSQGTLLDFLSIHSNTEGVPLLSENQVRGIIKSVAGALVYLRKELVLHRNVTPSNILVTAESRIKLGDFSLAVRLPMANSTLSTLCGSPNYVSPEMIARVPYSFPSDVWSLGCVMLICITGHPPFEGNSVTETYERVSRGKYEIPSTTSINIKHLLSELLQMDPKRRIKIDDILSHPFLKSSRPTDSLTPQAPVPVRSSDRPLRGILELKSDAENHPLPLRKDQNSDSSSEPDDKRHGAVVTEHIPLGKPALLPRHPFVNKTNTVHGSSKPSSTHNSDLRRTLSEEIKPNIKDKPRFPQVQTGRRVFSAPEPRATTSGISSSTTRPVQPRPQAVSLVSVPGLTEDTSSETSARSSLSGDNESDIRRNNNEVKGKRGKFILLRPLNPTLAGAASREPTTRRTSVPWLRDKGSPLSAPFAETEPVLICQESPVLRPSIPVAEIPVGLIRPPAFTTGHLQPQTHKLSCGQISVLAQTRSVLVDLRERERRKGRKGDKVLVIHADGHKIEVYDAPHLSTPCCLVEPAATYTLDNLPQEYWKQYGDAGSVLRQIKQRTPKLTMHLPDVRCTLMSNEPKGDIELLFPDAEQSRGRPSSSRRNDETLKPHMRVRLSRNNQSLEIARYVSYSMSAGGETGEWTKRVFPVPDSGSSCQSFLVDTNVITMDAMERKGLDCLRRFLKVCDAMESAKADTEPPPGSRSGGEGPVQCFNSGLSIASHSPQLATSPDMELCEPAGSEKSAEMSNAPPFQTRFMPSVGWCMRYSTQDEGQRYRLLFLDGLTMEIDFVEQKLKIISQDGETTHVHLQDGRLNPKVEDRLKSFHQFVPLFSSD
ncbi:kinase-like protein [Neolentinus lepideus HHB14362 ss-1]|uniref:Kinase-like protein n=1 Tax=Neolentinus lepideus HHB14362 ss-1 TaxID=1314782 RepID=A0A165NE36_9AGAM|nr:kinase-like protein [Neolentinus lepideus HHB14362 ss-1]